MKSKLFLLMMVVMVLILALFAAYQPASAEPHVLYVTAGEGTDIWSRPPSMDGNVMGHLPQGMAVTVYGVIGIEPNAWAKIDLFPFWVRYHDLGDYKWEPEG